MPYPASQEYSRWEVHAQWASAASAGTGANRRGVDRDSRRLRHDATWQAAQRETVQGRECVLPVVSPHVLRVQVRPCCGAEPTIVGVVRESGTGRPIPGATVTCEHVGGDIGIRPTSMCRCGRRSWTLQIDWRACETWFPDYGHSSEHTAIRSQFGRNTSAAWTRPDFNGPGNAARRVGHGPCRRIGTRTRPCVRRSITLHSKTTLRRRRHRVFEPIHLSVPASMTVRFGWLPFQGRESWHQNPLRQRSVSWSTQSVETKCRRRSRQSHWSFGPLNSSPTNLSIRQLTTKRSSVTFSFPRE